MNLYSPILLFAFKRLDSLKRTVESLKSNPESISSDLFVFVDGPRNNNPDEKDMVDRVRHYVSGIEGFNNVYCSYSMNNIGLGPSIIQGVSSVIVKYGKVIVLEDDLLLSKNFLSFMNQGLTVFEKEQKIFSVCGYSNIIRIPKDYSFDAYFCQRSSSWGWGTWIDRWNTVDWNLNDWSSCKKNRYLFNRWGGSDCFSMLKSWKEGNNQSWAIRFCYSQYLQDRLSVFPNISKVNNVGFDGFGTNCRQYNRFVCDFDYTDNKLFKWPDSFCINKTIIESAMSYNGLAIRAKTWLRNRTSLFSIRKNVKNMPPILIVAPFPPPAHGSSMVSQQLKDSSLLSASFSCDFLNISTSRKIKEIGNFSISVLAGKMFRFISAFLHLFWKLLSGHHDLCYLAITCHGKGFVKDAPFVLLCKLFGKKIVIHQHNKGMAGDVDRPVVGRLLRLVYRNAKVILLSDRLYPDIERIVSKDNIFICPNGIEQTVFQTIEHEQAEVPQILFLSNLLLDKGVMVLLDALRSLKMTGSVFRCVFVGNESKDINSEIFRSHVNDLGLNDCVSFLGPLYGDYKNAIFRQSDIFVLPSFNEAFPLVLLEAMQYSLPIVTTNIGGIPDIVTDDMNGLIVPVGDSKSLASALERLITDRDMRIQYGQAGFDTFANNFTQKHFEKRMSDILQRCIND